jgi:hypothetical protein
MRLCWQGFTLYSAGVLPIKVDDPEAFREFGRAVADAAGHNANRAWLLIEEYKSKFDETESVLPSAPDEKLAEQWLLDVRALHYDGLPYGHLSTEDKALHYMTRLIKLGVVEYTTVKGCQQALANLTKGLGG